MRAKIALVLILSTLTGCANFKAASEFAKQTSLVTGVVRDEFGQLDAMCRHQAELTIVVNNITDDGPLKSCLEYQAAQGRLAVVTLDVLDDYANALAGLANNNEFELKSDIDAVGAKVKGLQDGDGRALVSTSEVTVLTSLVATLADVATEGKRESAVRRLIAEKANLQATGLILRSFFVADPQAPPGRVKAPYFNMVGLAGDSLASTEQMLASKPFQSAEPIRTVELLRTLRVRKARLAERTGGGAGKVPLAIAAAIDAWLEALDRFSADALKPEPKELLNKLKDLRTKAGLAKAALQSNQN